MALYACNIKPVRMRGIISEGMIICACTEESVQILELPAGSDPGDIVSFPDYPGNWFS